MSARGGYGSHRRSTVRGGAKKSSGWARTRAENARKAATGAHDDGTPLDEGEYAQAVERAKKDRQRSKTTRRTHDLPPDWPVRRQKVLERDGWRCQLELADRCVGEAKVVDHIDPKGSDELDNLQALCVECNNWKTARDAAQVRHEAERQQRRSEHPGYLQPDEQG